MVVRLRVRHAEADRDDIEKRRVGELRAPAAEIVSCMEDEFEPPCARLIGAHQRLAGAAVRIGHDIDDELALGAAPQLVKLDADALRRPCRWSRPGYGS